MDRQNTKEATLIVRRVLLNLAQCVQPKGRAGSDARTAIGDLYATAAVQLAADTIGPPFDWCFQLVIAAGASVANFATVRTLTEQEEPVTLGGTMIKNVAIDLCLSAAGQIIAGMTFASRSDVEDVMQSLQQPFADAEEIAADDMDAMIYQALVALHANITNHLVKTATPLPRMRAFEFFEPLPSLVMAHRLYADAGRADELVAENRAVHPAFMPRIGRALSS